MARRLAVLASLAVCFSLISGVTQAASPTVFSPGAPGAGDPYYPLDGNGGYDVGHYLLDVRYDPDTDFLTGVATITAMATQNLSRFNLDLEGLSVESITVNGRAATWSRDGGELTVTPSRGIRNGTRFVTIVEYSGVPETLTEFGVSGFIHTDDGAMVVGEPHVADTWFPSNDHPSDTAAFTFLLTVPDGREAIANGTLEGTTSQGGWTTWEWRAKEPMATYLAGVGIGEFDVRSYKHDGIKYWDAIDVDLFTPSALPRTGMQFALSLQADFSYKRLSRTIVVPAEGGQLSFWVTRDTEPGWDHFFVEAHTVGIDDWTTLPDLNGHNNQETGFPCPFWLELHPFLQHYQTGLPDPDPEDEEPPGCEPSGTTGDWWAASGFSGGWEEWSVDLSPWAGASVEVSLSYASDESVQLPGVFIDDITVSTGEGTTSFEADADELDGWTVPGAPAGSPGNENDWIVGTAADGPPPPGDIASNALSHQNEIIAFEEQTFGNYPFTVAGGIVDDLEIGFALENQTRPIYSFFFFFDPIFADFVIVHELAHQWYGDSLTVAAWQHIWLNEGFATYAEWLWSEEQGFGTTQENFDFLYSVIPEEDPFWSVVIGDPTPELLFDFAVYGRGAMTLQQLRLAVGDDNFLEILRRWAHTQAGENVTTDEFISLAEEISGQQLDQLFEIWLFTPGKPDLGAAAQDLTLSASARAEPPAAVHSLMERFKEGQPTKH